jgi:hypothetical protein
MSEKPIMTAPSVTGQTRTGPGPRQRSHIAQHEKAAIESIQISAKAGAMAGIAASKKQPIFEQLSLANIFVLHWRDDPAGDADARRRWAAT